MKTIYIPRGETVQYERLAADRLVVRGCLRIADSLRAKIICGDGVIHAGSVQADVIRADEVESAEVVCKRLIAKRVQTPTLVASISAVVSCFLSAAHVKAGKLTVAASEIDQLEAGEVVNLSPRKCGMLGTLLTAWLHAFWGTLTAPKAKRERLRKGKRARASQKKQKKQKKQEKLDDTARAEIARTVREIMEQERSSQDSADTAEDEDFELKRLVSMFKLLREKGYTLRILPGTPEENAPAFDFETETILRPAA